MIAKNLTGVETDARIFFASVILFKKDLNGCKNILTGIHSG